MKLEQHQTMVKPLFLKWRQGQDGRNNLLMAVNRKEINI